MVANTNYYKEANLSNEVNFEIVMHLSKRKLT